MTERARTEEKGTPANGKHLETLIEENNELLKQLISQLEELNHSHHFTQGQLFDSLGRLSKGQRSIWRGIAAALKLLKIDIGYLPDELIHPPVSEDRQEEP